MIVNLNDIKLRENNLSTSFIKDLEMLVKSEVVEDEQTMSEIKSKCEEEMREFPNSSLTLRNRIDLMVDEIVSQAVSKVKIYCSFSVEVQL